MWEGSGLSRLPVRVLFVFLSDKSIWDLGGFRCACRNQLQPGVLTFLDVPLTVLTNVVENPAVIELQPPPPPLPVHCICV